MKILMATMGMDIGGAETHIVELSKELTHQGHQVVIVSNGGVYVPEVEAAGIRHYEAPLNRRSFSSMHQAQAVLRRVIQAEKPDVVHAHARIPAFLCGRLQKSLGFAFVTSCHGVYQVSGVLRLLSNWGERTLAVSDDIRDYLVEQYHIPPEHITLTINGIDTEKFSPGISGRPIRRELALGDGPVIAHVSRLDRETVTAARQLVDIAPALAREYPGLSILIVGGGTAFDELKAQAETANQAIGRTCLVLTGPRTDVNELVAAGDLFVGVSRAALEAMAAGKPVILSGAQGHTGLFTPDLLDKAVDTNFCCRTDPVATQEQLRNDVRTALALSPGKKEELGEYGRSVVQKLYSVHRMAADCLSVYDQVRRRRFRVVMSGYYGFSNAGDDAILQSIHGGILAASDDIQVTVLSHDPEQTRRQYGLDAVYRFDLVQVGRALRRCDALLSGGGSLLQDRTSTRSLLYYLMVIRWAKKLGKPVMLYANGIGPVTKPENRKKVKQTVELANVVTLRDRASAQELRDMGVKHPELHITADPMFNLLPAGADRGRELLAKAGLPAGRKFAAVSVRDWPAARQFPQQAARLCDHLHRTYGLETVFLLMQPAADRETTEQVRRAMESPSYLLDVPATPSELMAVLGQAELCVAMRLHTLIFAARMAVPTVGLVYDPKVDSYLKELDLPSAGEVERFDVDRACQVCDELMADYDRILARLKERSAALSAAARENEALLLELLRKKS